MGMFSSKAAPSTLQHLTGGSVGEFSEPGACPKQSGQLGYLVKMLHILWESLGTLERIAKV